MTAMAHQQCTHWRMIIPTRLALLSRPEFAIREAYDKNISLNLGKAAGSSGGKTFLTKY